MASADSRGRQYADASTRTPVRGRQYADASTRTPVRGRQYADASTRTATPISSTHCVASKPNSPRVFSSFAAPLHVHLLCYGDARIHANGHANGPANSPASLDSNERRVGFEFFRVLLRPCTSGRRATGTPTFPRYDHARCKLAATSRAHHRVRWPSRGQLHSTGASACRS